MMPFHGKSVNENCIAGFYYKKHSSKMQCLLKRKKKNGKPIFHGSPFVFGAGYGTRTRRLLLGKQPLYRMS